MPNKCICPMDKIMRDGCPSTKGEDCPTLRDKLFTELMEVEAQFESYNPWDEDTEEMDAYEIQRMLDKMDNDSD